MNDRLAVLAIAVTALTATLAMGCSSSSQSNGAGSDAGANDAAKPLFQEGGINCDYKAECATSAVCCFTMQGMMSTGSCTTPDQCGGSRFTCSATAHCSGGQVCCYSVSQGSVGTAGAGPTSSCKTQCAPQPTEYQLCGSDMDCPSGSSCQQGMYTNYCMQTMTTGDGG